MSPGEPSAFTVTELVQGLRREVESGFRQVWVKGEVSSLKSYGRGDWYFTLRDESSCIRCVMWKTYTERARVPPEDGTEVYVLGSPTIWEKKGDLRLPVVVMLPTAGVGLQQLAKEKAREALARDGLLDPERKRPLPRFPSAIAIITSHDGAALHDMVVIARRRWPRVRLLLVGARVQGVDAPRALVRALAMANRLGADLCIVGRGGGSREDLLAFDDEAVCRAIGALRIPCISAVGHETDIPLADLVADVRAPTPSAAIELALPDREEWLRHVGALGNRLAYGLSRRTGRLTERLDRLGDRLRGAVGRRVADPRTQVERLAAQLEALSPLKVLGRGFSVARLPDGRVVRRVVELPPGTDFTLRVSDGEVPSRATGSA